LKRRPRTPTACQRRNSAGDTSASATATPRSRFGSRASASSIAALSRPWALPCTSTPREHPTVSSVARYFSSGASGGV
jgi:hypothetical protein